jgi:hypothetical protein
VEEINLADKPGRITEHWRPEHEKPTAPDGAGV